MAPRDEPARDGGGGGDATQDDGAPDPARRPRRGTVPASAARRSPAGRPAGADRHLDHHSAVDWRDPGTGRRRALERDPARAQRSHREPPRGPAGLRLSRALLPDRRADDGRRRRAQRARRAAGAHDSGEGEGTEPDGVPPARHVVSRPDLPAAVGDDALRDLDPHLRRGLRARAGGAGRGRGQGGDAGALVHQPSGLDLALDRRDHPRDERRPHRRHVVDRLVRADGGALLRDPSPRRRAHLHAVSTRLRPWPADPRVTRWRPISGTEWRTIGIILSASALWLTDGVHHLDPALPALLGFAALLTPGLGPLVWGDLERGVGWANFFVIAASISLAHALGTSGAAPWLGRLLVGGLPAFGDSALAVVVLLMLGATLLRVVVPNISGFLALALPIAMSVGREAGVSPVACALVVMMTGDAVVYYPAQSSSALVIYERGHVSAAEMLRFGLWMTLVGWLAILVVALPWWSLVGQPLRAR